MNLTKLAQAANVSVSTVSKAFSDSPEISEQTKEMIFRVAKENNCFDKYYKPKYPKKVIAVICPEMLGIHYTQMTTFLSREITAKNGTMVMSASDFSHKKEQELVDYYTSFVHADGIIIIEPSGSLKNNTDVPIVQIGAENESKNIDCINVDVANAMDEAMKYIVSKNMSKIGFIGESYAVQEHEYYKNALKRNSIPEDNNYVFISDKRFYDAGYYATDEMLSSGKLPDVIFAAYSHIAVGILQRLKEEKLSVPYDVSVICMDDIASIPYSDISLSCIKMHLDEVCATSLDMLYQKIEKKYIKAKRTITVTRQFKKGQSIK